MLKFLRSKQKKIFLGLAIAIVPPFVLWGVMTTMEEKKASHTGSLASYGNKTISVDDFRKSYLALYRQAELFYGSQMRQLEPYLNLKGQAFDRILLLNWAKTHNISANDDDVVRWITGCPVFQGRGGFDDRAYKAYVKYLRTDPRTFEEEVRGSLSIDKIREGIDKKITLTDDDLVRLYQQQESARDLRYVYLAADPEKEKANIKDEELKKIYDSMKGQFQKPDKVKFSYLVIAADAPADLKGALALKEAPLDEIAKKFNLTVQSTDYIVLTESTPETVSLPMEVRLAASNLEPGKESAWIEAKGPSYKLKVLDKKMGGPMSFEEAKPMILSVLSNRQAQTKAQQTLESLRKDLTSDTFEQKVKEAGLEIAIFQKYQKGSALPVIGTSPILDRELANLKTGDLSDTIRLVNGAMIVQVTRDTPVDQEKFKAEKDKFKEKAYQNKSREEFKRLVETLRKDLKINVELMNQAFPDNEK